MIVVVGDDYCNNVEKFGGDYFKELLGFLGKVIDGKLLLVLF